MEWWSNILEQKVALPRFLFDATGVGWAVGDAEGLAVGWIVGWTVGLLEVGLAEVGLLEVGLAVGDCKCDVGVFV